MNKYVNLTPHTVSVITEYGPNVNFPPSGDVAQVSVIRNCIARVNGIQFYEAEYGPINGLPVPSEGVSYIVSGLVRSRCRNRIDVYSPGDITYDEHGQSIGCQGLNSN